MTSLADYVKRMKDKQDAIFFMAGNSRQEVINRAFTFINLRKRCFISKHFFNFRANFAFLLII